MMLKERGEILILVSKVNLKPSCWWTNIFALSSNSIKFMFCAWKFLMFISTENIQSDDYVDMTQIHIEIAL